MEDGQNILDASLRQGVWLPFACGHGTCGTCKVQAPEDLIFIAGGSGLSSPQSMVLDLLEHGDARKITLLQGARNLAELYNRKLFEELSAQHANFTYVPSLDNPLQEHSWEGFTGYVHEAAISVVTRPSRVARRL